MHPTQFCGLNNISSLYFIAFLLYIEAVLDMQSIREKGFRTLKWLERYAKIDMIYLARGSFWSTIGQVVSSLATFLMAIAFAHFVSKEAYGQYKYILSIGSILATFTMTGLGLATFESVSRGFEGTLHYAFWQNIKWSVLFFIGAAGTSIYYFVNGNASLGISILIVGCLWPIFSSTNFYSSYLTAKKDFRRIAIYFTIIGNLFPYLCLLLTIMRTSNPVVLVFVYFASNALIGLILYQRIVKIYKPNNKVDPNMMTYSKHLSLISILGGFSDNIDQILVFHFIGPVQLAIYNFATAIPNQIKGPIQNLGNLILPKFTERSDKEIKAGMSNKYMLLFITSVVFIATYWITAPYIFQIFFPKYMSSVFYSQIFSLSLLYMFSIPANAYLSAKKKIKEQYINSISGVIVQMILLTMGIMWWGLIGLVIARVIIRLVWAIIVIILYNKASINPEPVLTN